MINDLQKDLQWLQHNLLHRPLPTCKWNNYYTKNRAMKAVFMKQASKCQASCDMLRPSLGHKGAAYHRIQKGNEVSGPA